MESNPDNHKNVLVTIDSKLPSNVNITKKRLSLNANLKKDDLGLLGNKDLKRSKWSLGYIFETPSGPGNVVRVVKA